MKRPYQKLGVVRSKVNFSSADPFGEEADLCRNYYNRAVKDLVQLALKQQGDAVIDVRSVVLYQDGTTATFQTPECSDDGLEGQILAQGIAVRWQKSPPP